MPRKTIEVNRQSMTDIITRLETTNTYPNQTALFQAVVSEYQSAHNTQLTTSVVYLRVKEWGVVLKTQKGKKGLTAGSPRPMRKSSGKNLFLRKEMERRKEAKPYLHLLNKSEKGSLKAALKLNCLYCANWQPKEVKFCRCVECPLYQIRPYQLSNQQQFIEPVMDK